MSIADYLYHFAKVTPAAPAMIYHDKAVSYRAFANAVSGVIEESSSCSLPSRCTVAVMIPKLSDCWVVTLALQAQGFSTICVSSLELLESLEVRDLAALFVLAEGAYEKVKRNASVPVIAISKARFDGDAIPEKPAFADLSDDGGHILYTSGTTGSYKKYLLTADTQIRRDLERTDYYKWDNHTRFHGLNFGLWTAIGFNMAPSIWSVGGCVLFDQRDDWPDRFFDKNPGLVWLLPDQALLLSEKRNPRLIETADNDDLVLHVCGGFLSNRVALRLRENVSKNIVVTYGSSEINSASFEQHYQSVEDLSWFSPTGNRVIEIVYETDQVCPLNQQGQLRIKLTDLDTHAYLDNPKASSNAFRSGFFYPGDIAVQREDGKFRILGRVADVVNLGGQKQSVAPIEVNLQRVLQVDYVCLFSGMGSSGETLTVIAIEAAELPDRDRLDHVGREFSQWGEVRFAYVYPFPRTQSGTSKIDRKRLRQIVFSESV